MASSETADEARDTTGDTPPPGGDAVVKAASVPAPAPPAKGAETGESKGKIRVRIFARTDVGQVREHNEDNFLVADLTRRQRGLLEANRANLLGEHGVLLAVCDGMGGAAAGEVASQLAVDILYERMVDGLEEGTPISRDALALRLVRAVELAGMRIFQEAKADRSRRGMGTTVTASALVDDHLFLAQVGDSRAYILRGKELVQVTRDQSLVNQLIEAGQLTEEEAEHFEHNNIILQALGTADTVQVDLTYVQVQPGDTLLLCSDGLSGMVRNDELRETLLAQSDPVEVCKALTDRANQAGGHDNITVVIAQFEGDGLTSTDSDLRYKKYPLPETNAEGQIIGGTTEEPTPVFGPGVQPVSDDAQPAGAKAAAQAYPEDQIEIPGTHVPVWLVILLVVGVIAVLGGAAAVLLR